VIADKSEQKSIVESESNAKFGNSKVSLVAGVDLHGMNHGPSTNTPSSSLSVEI
jgi:hypothetical protein